MTLLLIMLIISVLFGVFMAWDDYERGITFFVSAFITFMILFLPFLGLQYWGSLKYEKVENVTYSQKIVSLNDGTGVEGSGYGGMFVYRSYIADTQHFSYYREVGPSQYVLEKRDAGASTIHADATLETARLDITDGVWSCQSTWWYVCVGQRPNYFVHADFHVPADSIKNDFTLDAQ